MKRSPAVLSALFLFLALVAHCVFAESAAARLKSFRETFRMNPVAAIRGLKPADDPRIIDELVGILHTFLHMDSYFAPTLVLIADETLMTTSDGKALDRLHHHFRTHSDKMVRLHLARLLGRMHREESFFKLKAALARASEADMQAALIEALANYDAKRAADVIIPFLSPARRPEVRKAAVEALGSMKAQKVVDKLIPLALEGNVELRSAALWALGLIGGEKARQTVLSVMKNGRPPLRAAACAAAAELPGDDVREALCERLKDGEWEVVSAAVNALRRRNELESVGPLVEAMQSASGRLLDDFRDALETITGYRFGSDPKNWKEWYEETGGDVKRNPRPHEDLSRYVTYHKIKTRSLNMVFCIDVSGSMNERASAAAKGYLGEGAVVKGNTKLDFAKAELVRALRSLPPEAFFDIIAFSDKAVFWRGVQTEAKDTNKKSAVTFVEKLKAGGGTNIHAALKAAFGKLKQSVPYYPSVRRPDTVFLLSDGLPTVGEIIDPAVLVETVTALNRIRQVRIHTICIGKEGEPFLKPLALRNGGQYVLIAK